MAPSQGYKSIEVCYSFDKKDKKCCVIRRVAMSNNVYHLFKPQGGSINKVVELMMAGDRNNIVKKLIKSGTKPGIDANVFIFFFL